VAGMAPHPGGGYWMVSGRPILTSGAVGPGVENLQRRLVDLGFWGPVDGRFGPLTTQQVYAFQKANGLPRDGTLDGVEMGVLARAQRVVPRFTTGRAVEVDKTRQLLIVSVDGYTEWVFNTSTGNGRPYGQGAVAITPEGRFRFTRQIDGLRISELGELFRPKYFVGGYAIHGSPSVPPFPASHGCVRLTNAAINFIWANDVVPLGTELWVYS
jgi:peptidoglycan hydrolase-like protein with peptidoglycan-binding domain